MAEKRGRKLLKETLEKFSDRIEKGTLNLKGYVIKGQIMDYFIDKNNLEIYTYPGAVNLDFCDDGLDEAPFSDRLVSRIYLLLNDNLLLNNMQMSIAGRVEVARIRATGE